MGNLSAMPPYTAGDRYSAVLAASQNGLAQCVRTIRTELDRSFNMINDVTRLMIHYSKERDARRAT